MTREEAIKDLKELEYYNRPFDNSEEAADVATRKAQAVHIAIQALEQIGKIKTIIDSGLYIQEDVLRYKMICEVVEK